MATTFLEVVDSAVKIGLGALISGTATYAVTQLQNKHSAQKDFISRKYEMLRESAECLGKFNEYSHACSLIIVDVVKKNVEAKELHNAAKELSKGLTYITKSITNIELLGEENPSKKLQELKTSVVLLINFVNNCGSKDASECSVKEYNKLIDKVSQLKKESTEELSKVFTRNTA